MTTADQEVESAPLVTSLNGSGGQNNNKGHNTKKAFNKEQQQPNNNSDYTTDKDATPFILLGTDISHYKREQQYAICACSLFSFSLLYGYLQELITVQMFSRDLALFLSTVQFAGYTLLVYVLRNYVYPTTTTTSGSKKVDGSANHTSKFKEVPPYFYVSIALLRALEMGLTNLAMQYINFPAKTLLKSSRIIFTMFFGLFIQRKKYRLPDYLTVVGMAIGLALFLRADSKSAAVFHYMGVVMLVLSLFCDGAMVNLSETIMTKYGVGQDEFIFRVYSISLVAVTIVGALRGDLDQGMLWMSEPGTYKEFLDNVPMAERTWSVPGKIVVLSLFSATGFFALSICSAITKNFGALTMSVTSTARKATTLFLSFFLFKDNVFTAGHLVGIVVFVTSLLGKVVLRRDNDRRKQGQLKRKFSGIDLLGRQSETNGKGGGGTQQVHGSCDNSNGQHNHNHNTTSTQAAAATSSGGGKENKDHLTLRHGAAAGP